MMNNPRPSVVIPAEAALSNELDLRGYDIEAIFFPAAWTAAAVTFVVLDEPGGVEHDAFDSSNVEIEVDAAAGRFVKILPEHSVRGANLVRIRSGTSGTPVNQAAERVLKLSLRSNT